MAKEYKDQILDTSVNEKRVYNIVDSDGNIVAENVSFEDKTVYLQDGTEFGAQEVNEIYEAIEEVNQSLKLVTLFDGDVTLSSTVQEISLLESQDGFSEILVYLLHSMTNTSQLVNVSGRWGINRIVDVTNPNDEKGRVYFSYTSDATKMRVTCNISNVHIQKILGRKYTT